MITHVMALPEGLRRFTLADLPRERWRNNMGWTRPVAAAGSAGTAAWRISLAEITQAAPFSRFEGMDRTAVLAHGGPLRLLGADQAWDLAHPGDIARFPGELPLHNTSPDTPARIWNVMTRRGEAQADVTSCREGAVVLPADIDTFAWVISGRFVLSQADGLELCVLTQEEGLHRRPTQMPLALQLHAASPDAHLIVTHLA